EFLANTCAPSPVHHAHVGNSLRSAGERHDLLDAHTTCGGGYPAREASAAPVSHRARDERKHRQRGYASGQPAKHDHRTFLAHFVFRIFQRASAGGSCWAGDYFFHFAFWFSKNVTENSNRSCRTRSSKTRAQSVRACLRCARV